MLSTSFLKASVIVSLLATAIATPVKHDHTKDKSNVAIPAIVRVGPIKPTHSATHRNSKRVVIPGEENSDDPNIAYPAIVRIGTPDKNVDDNKANTKWKRLREWIEHGPRKEIPGQHYRVTGLGEKHRAFLVDKDRKPSNKREMDQCAHDFQKKGFVVSKFPAWYTKPDPENQTRYDLLLPLPNMPGMLPITEPIEVKDYTVKVNGVRIDKREVNGDAWDESRWDPETSVVEGLSEKAREHMDIVKRCEKFIHYGNEIMHK